MPIHITAEDELQVGSATVVEGPAPQGPYIAVFEDDETTGYFYALDPAQGGNPIQSALHIYDVDAVVDRERPSTVTIAWSAEGDKAVLLINDYPHAVFDFVAKRGYCRTGFPPPPTEGAWAAESHDWDDAALDGLF